MPDVIVVPRAPAVVVAVPAFRPVAALPGPRVIDAEFTTDAPRPVGPEIRLHPERVEVVTEPKKKKNKKKKKEKAQPPPPPAKKPPSDFNRGIWTGILIYFGLGTVLIVVLIACTLGKQFIDAFFPNGANLPPWKGPDVVQQASLPMYHEQSAPVPQPPTQPAPRLAHKAPVRHK